MTNTTQSNRKDDERVLVMPTDALREFGTFQGFCPCDDERARALLAIKPMEFMRRGDAERDPEFKQLIPYVIFQFLPQNGGPEIFVYRRGKGQGEKRLVAKWSAGIGGHVNDRDLPTCGDGLELALAGARREIEEEVVLEASVKSFELVGLVNDDATEVGTVHLGLICLATLDAPVMWSNESDITDARFRPVDEVLDEIRQDPNRYESWTNLALENLY